MHPLCYEYLLVIGVCILHFKHNKKHLVFLLEFPELDVSAGQTEAIKASLLIL